MLTFYLGPINFITEFYCMAASNYIIYSQFSKIKIIKLYYVKIANLFIHLFIFQSFQYQMRPGYPHQNFYVNNPTVQWHHQGVQYQVISRKNVLLVS